MTYIKSFFNIFLNIFFPKYCISCKKESYWICPKCLFKNIQICSQQFCPVSNTLSPQGAVTSLHKKDTELDGLLVCAEYKQNHLLQKLLKKLKYFFAFDIAKELSPLLTETLENNNFSIEDYTICAVPLHWRRQLERGFNQSTLLAQNIKKPKLLLKRHKYTQQQAKLNKTEREQNIQNAFSFIGKTVPKHVLLVDDISSTDSTLNACAKILKQAGVQKVWAIVIAKNR